MARRRLRWTNQRGRELWDGWERNPAVDPNRRVSAKDTTTGGPLGSTKSKKAASGGRSVFFTEP